MNWKTLSQAVGIVLGVVGFIALCVLWPPLFGFAALGVMFCAAVWLVYSLLDYHKGDKQIRKNAKRLEYVRRKYGDGQSTLPYKGSRFVEPPREPRPAPKFPTPDRIPGNRRLK